MPALLDTNAFLWFISGSERLSSNALNYIADFENDLVISAASLWKIAIKTSLGKLELLSPFDQLIPSQLEKNAIAVLSIELTYLTKTIDLEFHHRDPFDRLIIAQGITDKIPIITSDAVFAKYPMILSGNHRIVLLLSLDFYKGVYQAKFTEFQAGKSAGPLSTPRKRQHDGELGPLAFFGFHRDVTVMVLDEPVAHGKAQAHALDTLGLCGKK